jgi:DNA-binding winged helix-turn-helix (wHTH) protein
MASYRFGPFILNSSSRLLLRDKQPLLITAKVLDTLIVLVQNRGRLMSKEELLSTLWPYAAVEEANLAQVICCLRRALEDHPKEHRYIATIPGRGYVFVGAVSEFGAPGDVTESSGSQHASAEGVARNSVPQKSKFWMFATLISAALLICGAVYSNLLHMARKPATSPTVPLTGLAGSAVCPSFAPDGERVAFAWDADKQENFDIYVKQIGVGSMRRLTSDPGLDLSPAWSPDGREIAFLRFHANGRANVLLTPAVAPHRARSLTTITAAPEQYRRLRLITWSPDSKWLVVPDGPSLDGHMGLFLVSKETGEKRRLTQPPAKHHDFEPALSPNMRRIAFVRYGGDGTSSSELYVENLSGDLQPRGAPERLTFYNRHTASPVWTPDGRAILFTRPERSHGDSIWRIDALGTHESEPVATLAKGISALVPLPGRQSPRVRPRDN